jgi:leucyl aminopeptidase
MKIDLATRISKKAPAVILVSTAAPFGKHALVQELPPEDQKYLRAPHVKSRIREDSSTAVLLPSGKTLLCLGVGEGEKFTHRKSILAMRRVIIAAKQEKAKEVELHLNDFLPRASDGISLTPEETAENLAIQLELANFEFTSYKTPPKGGWARVERAVVVAPSLKASLAASVKRGKVIGEEINETRALANTPGGDMTPAVLAKAAQRAAKGKGVRVAVFNERKIRALKMGGVLGVSKGSAERPRFIVLSYLKGKKSEKPVVLVGKGVTFDTGGLNLKPSEHIYEMHMDMSGGAAVIHAITALARLRAKKNVIGLIPAVENMPSGSSYHPGDLLKTMGGKTIEVLNTDAEGRVILSDALEYAKRYKPRLVVDIATLTGAACVALGQRASALFTTERKFEKLLRNTGEKAGDYVWPLPLWEEYEEEIKGTFGDFANLGRTRYGGAITGAVFLWQFTKDASGKGQAYPWVHLDIAPRMTTIEGEYLAKGAAGAAVGLLVRFLQNF